MSVLDRLVLSVTFASVALALANGYMGLAALQFAAAAVVFWPSGLLRSVWREWRQKRRAAPCSEPEGGERRG